MNESSGLARLNRIQIRVERVENTVPFLFCIDGQAAVAARRITYLEGQNTLIAGLGCDQSVGKGRR